MAFSNTLRYLRKQDKLTQKELGDILGISKSTISMYENGNREPDFETLEKIADYFNVDMNILTGISAQAAVPYDNILPFPRMNAVPLVGSIACGTPILAEENVEQLVDMPEHVRADFALRCKGDSMVGARIYDGDIVYIRQQPTVDNGEIAAILIDDEATLKRFYRHENNVVLQPENPAYPPRVYSGEELESVRILGKAVAFTSNIK